METRKNLCAMLPVALHTRVRQEQEKGVFRKNGGF